MSNLQACQLGGDFISRFTDSDYRLIGQLMVTRLTGRTDVDFEMVH